MPRYFVCEEGPMGGCSIVWVGQDRKSADAWIEQQCTIWKGQKKEYFVYMRVE